MKYTVLLSALLVLGGCGSTDSKDLNPEAQQQPLSPKTKVQENQPPSIPII